MSYSNDPYAVPPRRHGTDSSYYSCSDLDDDDRYRTLRASDVRRQVEAMPKGRYRKAPGPGSTSNKAKLTDYPKTFNNRDEIEDLQSKRPWMEYPIHHEPGRNWVEGADDRGKVRAIYTKGLPPDARAPFDVVYHNSKKSLDNSKNFSIAPYRPSRRAPEPEPEYRGEYAQEPEYYRR